MKKWTLLVAAGLCALALASCEKQQVVTAAGEAQFQVPGVIFQACDEADSVLVQEYADALADMPGSIQEIEVSLDEGKTPALMIPNGCVGILTDEDGVAWEWAAGDVLRWTFEKAPLEDNDRQMLVIGYLHDGVLSEPMKFDTLSVSCEIEIPETGAYYLYLVGGSSDVITIGEGQFTIELSEQ